MKVNIIACLIMICASCTIGLRAQSIDAKRVREDIEFLANDKLKGRGTSTPEEKIAAIYIAQSFKKAGLVALNGDYLKTFTFKKNANPHDTSIANVKERNGYNVVGFLDNKAPHTIVIGAHFDHLGLGHDHNSLDANPDGKIHNGADDNASGTAGVLELARYFSANKVKENYNFLFICFSGEELGLLGSKKWCESPDIPLNSVHFMLNMDMIGRLNDSTKKIVIYGVGTAPVFVPIIDSIPTQLAIKKDSSGIGPSDQTSFYLKDIPVLHFFTGQHSDYHKPSDDIDKINIKGEVMVLDYIAKVIEHTCKYPKLTFQKTKSPESNKVSFKVSMGVMPDYTFEGPGMRIDGVSDNRPAAKAGVLKGDIVKKIGDYPVKDVQEYMKALSKYSKGDTTTLEVERNGAIVKLNLTF